MNRCPFDAIAFCEHNRFRAMRLLPTGEWAAIQPQLFTTALAVGIDALGSYRTRFCYEDQVLAVLAIGLWDGEGWPPFNWIKQKPEDVRNPALEAQHHDQPSPR